MSIKFNGASPCQFKLNTKIQLLGIEDLVLQGMFWSDEQGAWMLLLPSSFYISLSLVFNSVKALIYDYDV
ncbi:hypothetical protein FRX31_013283 [Thalictrum thalictroides]|uniref:Uncharacterized protein n=1 Tax=Thalictrum thalictroides TaxID=46969 RepID=A0A7J6WJJ0_THATH|nr:hypothetical protein FRX31_013283 [Thalictrum thalictroides]